MDKQPSALRFEEHRTHLRAVAYRMLGSRSDAAAGTATTIRGAQAVAANARRFAANARFAEPALVDGAVGIVVAPEGRLALVLRFRVIDDKIAQINIDADPERLRRVSLALLD